MKLTTDCVECRCDDAGRTAFLDGIKKGQWVCYMLRSCKFRNRTYAGVTNDLAHRLRQHNGEIMGGARATQQFRPWALAAVVCGFGSEKSEAMRFEWFLKVCHSPSAKAYVPTHLYTPPPKEQRVSSICRRAALFEMAYEKMRTDKKIILTCLDADLALAVSDRVQKSGESIVINRSSHQEPRIHP